MGLYYNHEQNGNSEVCSEKRTELYLKKGKNTQKIKTNTPLPSQCIITESSEYSWSNMFLKVIYTNYFKTY